jgi:hypothetical protein
MAATVLQAKSAAQLASSPRERLVFPTVSQSDLRFQFRGRFPALPVGNGSIFSSESKLQFASALKASLNALKFRLNRCLILRSHFCLF